MKNKVYQIFEYFWHLNYKITITMSPKFKPVIYGIGVFAIYALLTYVLRLVTNRMPLNAEFLGVFTTNDLLLGLVVAIILTVSHERKKRFK